MSFVCVFDKDLFITRFELTKFGQFIWIEQIWIRFHSRSIYDYFSPGIRNFLNQWLQVDSTAFFLICSPSTLEDNFMSTKSSDG